MLLKMHLIIRSIAVSASVEADVLLLGWSGVFRCVLTQYLEENTSVMMLEKQLLTISKIFRLFTCLKTFSSCSQS